MTSPEAEALARELWSNGGPEPEQTTNVDTLKIEDVADVAARVDAKPPRRYLARGVIISGSYGGFAAEDTSGKSWAAMDLAVNVAAGGIWMGAYAIDHAGPVLCFIGEEDEDEWVRRGRAVAAFYGFDFDNLDIRVCQRVPKFANEAHVNAVRYELGQHPARLVIVDPLYLGFAGVKTSQLAEVGEALDGIRRACRDHAATLWIAHHWNKTGHGTGRERASGAGFKEWARTIARL